MIPAFKRPSESQVTFTQLMLPSHSNFSGKIHGGYILQLLDQIAFACASKHSENYCVTASVDKVNFLKPIEVGELVTMRATVNWVGTTSMVVGIRVEAENIKAKVVKHCLSSYFTMVAKGDDGKKTKIPGLILEDENQVRRFMRSTRRQASMRERREEFLAKNFVIEKYFGELKDYNVQVDL